MTVGIFEDCVFFLKVKFSSFKEKKLLRSIITSNGGAISFVLNQKCTHVVVNDIGALSNSQRTNVQKHHISLVDTDFIWQCLEEQRLIKDYQHRCDIRQSAEVPSVQGDPKTQGSNKTTKETKKDDLLDGMFLVCFCFAVLVLVAELLLSSCAFIMQYFEYMDPDPTLNTPYSKKIRQWFKDYRKQSKCIHLKGKDVKSLVTFYHPLKSRFTSSSIQGCLLRKKKIQMNQGFVQKDDLPPQAVPFMSEPLQKVLLEEAISTTKLSPEVGHFVESIWNDALGHLDNILSCPVNEISINDVSKAEGILLQVRKALDTGANADDIRQIMSDFYWLIPHKEQIQNNIDKKLLSTKQDLCQLIRDMVNVCETNLSRLNPSCIAKYQALRCRIEHVDPNTEEFLQLKQQILENDHSNESVNILKIYRIGRLSEATGFQSKLGNVKSLMHASSACNFVGILSRGLLLPKVVVEDLGLERTDIGNLGSGIYFSDSISTSVKYTGPSKSNGARLLVLCDVALGTCRDLYKRDFTLTEAPSGFHSVHGVRQVAGVMSDFEDDEFVVYKRDQVKMTHIVQFCTGEEEVNLEPDTFSLQLEQKDDDVGDIPAPLDDTDLLNLPPPPSIKGGLQGIEGNQIPLESIHVKARIMDLIAQVVVFQTYVCHSAFPIEAKYVFPLDSTAAVCGFEAFINGKHIVGEVKEKKQAHQEYRTAIKEGHGAYLMDQDAPDVFTVSVGNLPPKATVIIKITYIMELCMQGDSVYFHIPGTVASWQQDKALKEKTQDTVRKVCVEKGGAPAGAFCLDMSIEMPYKIQHVTSYTHKIKIKKTDCKAVIQTEKGSSLCDNGFSLYISMEDAQIPRMWVEKHPDKESEACMLVFQPQCENLFETQCITICLDCSNSMDSSFQNAKLVALLAVRYIWSNQKLNLINFGTSYKEFNLYPEFQCNNLEKLEEFFKLAKPNMGNTEFWKPLHSLSLLATTKNVQNILLISDGHIQNESSVFRILKKNTGKVRLFTCGVGAKANRHMLRCLAQHGSGAYEFFEEKSKSSWNEKINIQFSRIGAPACNAVSVKWRRFSQNDPEPVQAPVHIQTLFNNESLRVYGFVPHCTQATLNALINGQVLETMVSTTELQKTTGTMLHKLTARAIIRDYEDGIQHEKENEHEMKKQQMKSFIIELSKEYSIVTQFTSFVAVEKRDIQESQHFVEPNVQEIISSEDVDFLPYMDWEAPPPKKTKKRLSSSISIIEDHDMDYAGPISFADSAPEEVDIVKEDMDFSLSFGDAYVLHHRTFSNKVVFIDSRSSMLLSDGKVGFGGMALEANILKKKSFSTAVMSTMVQARKPVCLKPIIESGLFMVNKAFATWGEQELVLLGMRFNNCQGKVFLPEEKILLVMQDVLPALEWPSATINEYISALGRLVSTIKAVPCFQVHTKELQRHVFELVRQSGAPGEPNLQRQAGTFSGDEVAHQITHKVVSVLAYDPVPAKKLTSLVGKFICTKEAVPFTMAHTRELERFMIQAPDVYGTEYPKTQLICADHTPSPLSEFDFISPVEDKFYSNERTSEETLTKSHQILFNDKPVGVAFGDLEQAPRQYVHETEEVISRPFLERKPAKKKSAPDVYGTLDYVIPESAKTQRISLFSKQLNFGKITTSSLFASPSPPPPPLPGCPGYPPPPPPPVPEYPPPPPSQFGFSAHVSYSADKFFGTERTSEETLTVSNQGLFYDKPTGMAFSNLLQAPRQYVHETEEVISRPFPERRRAKKKSRCKVCKLRSPPISTPLPPPSPDSSGSPSEQLQELILSSQLPHDLRNLGSSSRASSPFSGSPGKLFLQSPYGSSQAAVIPGSTAGQEGSGSSTSPRASFRPDLLHQGYLWKKDVEKLKRKGFFTEDFDLPVVLSFPQDGVNKGLSLSSLWVQILALSVFFQRRMATLPYVKVFFQGVTHAFTDYKAPMPPCDLNLDFRFGEAKPFVKSMAPSWLVLQRLQSQEGYWNLIPSIGDLLKIDVTYLIDVFLNKKGINSLGRKGREDVLKLIATLLVLQVIRTYKSGQVILKALMKLDESSSTSLFYPSVEKAIKWARKTDQQFPGICCRLGLGKDWDSATRQLLNIEPMKASSELFPAKQ
ncbi:protein mono-ADP-ribosyltransferase PARP4 [Rhinophrynus dorsalis]